MTIDSTTSLEVRPLVLQSVVENGEAVVTLAESSTIDLHTLNIQHTSYQTSATNISGATVVKASISQENAEKLITAVLDPTVDHQDLGVAGWLSPYELHQYSGINFGDGPVKTFRLYFRILNDTQLQLSEDGQRVISNAQYPYFPIAVGGKLSQLEGEATSLIAEIVEENGVNYIKSLRYPVENPYAVPVLSLFAEIKMDEAALLANLPQKDDIFSVEFSFREGGEGYLSTPKLTGLNAPVDGTDAVNLDYVTAEAAALSATNAAQIAHIDSEVAILLDKIVNQDSIEVVSAERWTSPKAVVMEGQVQGTQVLANFDGSVANDADQSVKMAKKSFKVLNGSTFIGDPNFQLSDVNNDLVPGFYKLVVAASNQCGQFPACSYGNRGFIDADPQLNQIFGDCNNNPMTFDVRYYADETALNNDDYTVVASSVVSQGKIIVNAETFPNWKENPLSLSGPSYITVVEGTAANAGYVNTIPGFFSWYCKNNKLAGDISTMSMWITEMPTAGDTAVTLEVVDSLQISDVDPKFGTGCLVLDGEEKSFVRIMNDDKGMNFSGGNFCVEGWFKFDPANMNGSYKLFSLGNDVANGYNGQGQENPLSISIYTSSSWESIDLSYAYRNQSGQTDYLGRNVILRNGDGEGTSIVDNQWHHIALVFENGVFKVYVDGVVKVTEPTTDALDLNSYLDFSNIFIGGDTKYAGWISNMIGSVDCLRITAGGPVYTSNFTPSTTPLKFNLTGLGISFPDMKSLGLKSTSLGVVLANPPVDTTGMTLEEFANTMRRKLYTANVVENIVDAWETPEGEVFVGPNGDLVEQAPTSGRIIRVGKKLHTGDLLIDMQDYGFINAVTTKRKRVYEPLSPSSIPLDGLIARCEAGMMGILGNGDMQGNFSVKIVKASQAMYYLVTYNYEISEYTVMESGIINLYSNEYDGLVQTMNLPQGNFYFVVGIDELVDLPLANWNWDNYLHTQKSKFVQVYNQSANTEIASIQVNGMNAYEGSTISVPFTNSVDVQVMLSASSSHIDYISGASGMTVGDNQVEIRVVSASGIATSRYITVNVAPPSSNTNLSSIQVNGTVVAENGTISVPFTTSVTVTATPEDSNASIDYVMGNTGLVVGDNTVEIGVIAQNGNSAKHFVTVNVVPPSSNTNLSSIQVNGTVVAENGTFNAPYGTTSVTVTATPEDSNASIDYVMGNTGLVAGDNTVEINVVAQNGSGTKRYITVRVLSLLSSQTKLLLNFDGSKQPEGSMPIANVISRGGDSIDSSLFKFGSGSAKFEANVMWGGIEYGGATSHFKSGNEFCFEFWTYLNSYSNAPEGNRGLFMFASGWTLFSVFSDSMIGFKAKGANADGTMISASGFNWGSVMPRDASTRMTLNAWHHVAITKSAGDTSLRLFIDGEQWAILNGVSELDLQADCLYVGDNIVLGRTGSKTMNGNIDGVRYVVGSAVYTSNFTPPTAPFSLT